MFDPFKSRFLKWFTKFHDMFRAGAIPDVVRKNADGLEKDLEKFRKRNQEIKHYMEEYLRIRESVITTTTSLIAEAKRNNYSHFNEDLFADLVRQAQDADHIFEQMATIHKKK